MAKTLEIFMTRSAMNRWIEIVPRCEDEPFGAWLAKEAVFCQKTPGCVMVPGHPGTCCV